MAIKTIVAPNRQVKGSGVVLEVWCAPETRRLVNVASARTLRASALRILRYVGIGEGSVSVALLSPSQMRRLNRAHLGHDYVTDVVTFDLSGELCAGRPKVPAVTLRPRTRASRSLCGEICICPAEALRNARCYGEPFDRELLRYVAHGILHLLGWDDRTDRQRAAMRAREDEILTAIADRQAV